MAKKRAGGPAKSGNGKAQSADVLAIPVTFQKLGIGTDTARIGCKVNRERLNLLDADGALCGKRLIGSIVQGEFDPLQSKLWDDIEFKIDAAFDVKRFGVSPSEITFGLTFSLQSINAETLTHFANRAGGLIVQNVEAIPDKAESSDEHEEGEEEGED